MTNKNKFDLPHEVNPKVAEAMERRMRVEIPDDVRRMTYWQKVEHYRLKGIVIEMVADSFCTDTDTMEVRLAAPLIGWRPILHWRVIDKDGKVAWTSDDSGCHPDLDMISNIAFRDAQILVEEMAIPGSNIYSHERKDT